MLDEFAPLWCTTDRWRPMLDIAAIVPAAIAPALLLLWVVVAADSRPEPPSMVWSAFILGALSIFLLRYMTGWLIPHLAGTTQPELAVDEYALFVAAIPEETLKVLIIALFAFRARAFDEPMDGVVYGTAVGLGFAAHENLGYLMHSNDWEALAIIRGALTVPFHGALGAIAGAYIAGARFGGALGAHRHEAWARARFLLSAWAAPVVLHALFDIPLLGVRSAKIGSTATRAQWVLMAVTIGFGTIAMAVRLTLRIAGRQKGWPSNSRTPVAAWRRVWGCLVLGAGVGYAGAAMMIYALRHWSFDAASGPLMLGMGGALFALALVTYGWASRYLFDASTAHQRIVIKP